MPEPQAESHEDEQIITLVYDGVSPILVVTYDEFLHPESGKPSMRSAIYTTDPRIEAALTDDEEAQELQRDVQRALVKLSDRLYVAAGVRETLFEPAN